MEKIHKNIKWESLGLNTSLNYNPFRKKMDFTAVIRKGEKQFVALCPELDVVSQGRTIEKAIKNLKEACELYVEEMGMPEGVSSEDILVTTIGIKKDEKVTKVVRA